MPTTGPAPLELLAYNENRKTSFLFDKWAPLSCGTFGFLLACFLNWSTRRPVFSGIQKHALFTGIGAVGGKLLDDRRNNYLAERDAVLRHYIELHPEDFPAPERKKYEEVLAPWIPIR